MKIIPVTEVPGDLEDDPDDDEYPPGVVCTGCNTLFMVESNNDIEKAAQFISDHQVHGDVLIGVLWDDETFHAHCAMTRPN